MTIRKNDKALFDGVLVPELNYRNYTDLVDILPEYERLIHSGALPLCSEPSGWENPLLWGALGVILGGVAMKVIK